METQIDGTRKFRLDNLLPIDPPREDALKDITARYHLLGKFREGYGGLPMVAVIDGVNYLTDGNQRAIWLALNGYRTMLAWANFHETSGTCSKYDRYIEINNQFRSRNVHSVVDLAKTVRLPERFIVKRRSKRK